MASKPKTAPKKTYVLPAGTVAYPHVAAPDTEGEFADSKFKITVVMDADADLSVLRGAIVESAQEKFGGNYDEDNFKFPWTVRDEADKKEDFRGKITAVVKSQFKPQVVDAKKQEVPAAAYTGTDKKGHVYTKMAGDLVKAMVTLYLYEQTAKERDAKTKKMVDVTVYGCSLQLVAIQILQKRTGGNYANGFDEEDGYEAAAASDKSGDPGPTGDQGEGAGGDDF